MNWTNRHLSRPWMREDYQPRPCSTPTQARPATPEKLAVLIARAEAGEELWHPDDWQLDRTERLWHSYAGLRFALKTACSEYMG